jgi:hypothetical protein
MKVEVLVNLGTNDYPGHPYLAGEIHEVTDAVGAKLVSNGHARAIVSEPEPSEVTVKLVEPADPAITQPESVAVPVESKQDKPAKASLKSSKEK